MSEVGYGKPPKHTQFGAGESGNPIGKTSAQRKAEMEAAEQAAIAQKAMLDALVEHVKDDPTSALAAIKADPLKLIKDAMDRGLGTAVQKVDNTSSDGSMTPKPALDVSKLSGAAMEEILAATEDDETANES